jgi:hypothetical protein
MVNTMMCKISRFLGLEKLWELKNIITTMRALRVIIPALIAVCLASPAFAATPIVNVTPATGGSAIPNSNIASLIWVTLSGPTLTETANNGIGVGTLVLNAPAGFKFNTAASVTVSVGLVSGVPAKNLTLSSPNATVTATTITINVATSSAGTTHGSLTWSGIQVIPTFCSPLAIGNITLSGTSTANLSSPNLGTLQEIGSTALTYIQQPTNTLWNVAISPAVTLNACGSGAAVPTVTVALTTPAGATLGGTLVTTTNNTTGLATFSNLSVNLVGTYTLTATSPGLTSAVSSSFIIYYPVPTTTSISPVSTNVGAGSFTMTVNGTNFVPASIARFAGSNRATTYVSATQLSVTILSTDLITAGMYNIDVVNPVISGLGGGTSNPQTFTVLNVNPGRFNTFESSTASGAIVGNIFTKRAGAAFTLDVVALNLAKTAVLTTFTGAVKVELLNTIDNTGALDTNNCRSTWTNIQTLATNPVFVAADNGRKVGVSFLENNAWQNVRIRVTYPASGAATAIGCSTDNFAIRPNSLSLSITDNDWLTAGTTRALNNSNASGGYVHKAGQPFTIQASALNAAAVTTTYAGTPLAVACVGTATPGINVCNLAGVLLPAGTSACTGTACIGTPSALTLGAATAGVMAATYSEVGAFTLQLQDQTFANVDSGDGTPADCTGYYICSSAINVGRFVPDHFDLAVNNTPQFRTFNNTCAAVRSFTYFGQPFGYVTAPQVLVTAYNGLATPAVTANYRNSLWKITTAAPVKTCTTGPDTCTLLSTSATSQITQTYTYTTTPAATPNWDSSQVVVQPPIVVGSNGTGTVTSNAADVLAFLRSLSTPQQLITADITLTESVRDTSEAGNCGIAGAGVCDITTTTSAAFNPIAFDAGGNEFRYGRLKLGNAHGSELLALPVPFVAQYWNGTGFVTNTNDNCTQVLVPTVANGDLVTNPVGLATNATLNGVAAVALGTLVAGDGKLKLSKPNASGYVNIKITDTPAYLKFDWDTAAAGLENPSARATFGVYKGANEFIYLRENY